MLDTDIKTILTNGYLTTDERGQLFIRTLSRTVDGIVNYNYCCSHYNGSDSSTVINDKLTSVKKNLAMLISDMELYMEHLNITDEVRLRAAKRIEQMAKRIREREEENGN